jgi:hypothetical protein
MTMKQQLFISEHRPQKELFKSPSNGHHFIKPTGGMWTSSLIDWEHGSDWVRWCLEEQFSHGSDNQFPSWLLTPEDGVRVYTVDGFKDLQELHSAGFTFKPYEGLEHFTGLNFEALAGVYDAIHLTERGQAETRFSVPNLYGWDCESVLWLKWAFKEVQTIGVRSYELGVN